MAISGADPQTEQVIGIYKAWRYQVAKADEQERRLHRRVGSLTSEQRAVYADATQAWDAEQATRGQYSQQPQPFSAFMWCSRLYED